MTVEIKPFFHEPTFTVSYVVSDTQSGRSAIIDSVLDYDHKSGRTDTSTADEICAYVASHDLRVDWILETHVHADHLSAAPYLKSRLGGLIGVGEHVCQVQEVFQDVFNAADEMPADGSQFDKLLKDGFELPLGQFMISVMHTPGHTPACVSYKIEDAVFVGDTLFMPDYGTARCDFPGGDAAQLYRSIKKILSLPKETRLFMCHDYAPDGRDYKWETTVAEQLSTNIHIHDGVSEGEFVEMRNARDAGLQMPVLILPSVQVNMRAGDLPAPEDNGVSYLKIPLNRL
ncbi:MBL fold metallo-hydrolase [Sneathiella glossodoripedis]|uniref:MBL fold metallo-hydrolase n=1 Tax=Sneathiella glossodoripedis TaxID=418853 RepID=UPI00046F7EBA|nr:MBL fold metallo-hydrolase [Sneathiella glossodoripedis]